MRIVIGCQSVHWVIFGKEMNALMSIIQRFNYRVYTYEAYRLYTAQLCYACSLYWESIPSTYYEAEAHIS